MLPELERPQDCCVPRVLHELPCLSSLCGQRWIALPSLSTVCPESCMDCPACPPLLCIQSPRIACQPSLCCVPRVFHGVPWLNPEMPRSQQPLTRTVRLPQCESEPLNPLSALCHIATQWIVYPCYAPLLLCKLFTCAVPYRYSVDCFSCCVLLLPLPYTQPPQ